MTLLVGACSHLSPGQQAAKPAASPAATLEPPPAGARQPPVSQQGLPAAPAIAPSIAAGTVPAPDKNSATVALLLPLSGPSASLGGHLLNAAQLALFEVADKNVNLLPFDTKGSPEGASTAIQQAVSQHADIIIGPLFSSETKAVAPMTRQAGISMLSLTNDRTAAGNGVFTLGFLPGQQAVRVAEYALGQNRPRLAILAPSGDYGRLVVEALENNPDTSRAITSLQYYDPSNAEMAGPIHRLVKPDPKKPGDVGFDALVLPEGGQRLKTIAAALPGQGIDPNQVKLLGTLLWEDNRGAVDPALVGGWYAAPPAANHEDFDNRYAKAFGGKPPALASLAYDATALAAVLARRSPRDFSPSALTNPTGFAGVDGIFRLRSDGLAERGYAIREVTNGGPDREIAPAPASFQAAY